MLDTLTAYENIALALTIKGENSSEIDGKIKAVSKYLEIEEVLEKYPTTIFMVTHESSTASYAHRILFIKDGKIFSELIRGNDTRKEFFNKIIEVISLLGGDDNNVF